MTEHHQVLDKQDKTHNTNYTQQYITHTQTHLISTMSMFDKLIARIFVYQAKRMKCKVSGYRAEWLLAEFPT